MEPKFKTSFSGLVTEISNVGEDGFELSEASKQRFSKANASLRELSHDLPYIDFQKNYDLQGIVFNAAVINKFNKNDDGISAATAIRSSHWYTHKPINIEHERSDVVGHIINHSFNEYGTNESLWRVQADNMEPFYLTLGGVIYKMAFPEFSQLLEDAANDKNDLLYKTISASWEVGFEEYVIAVGNSEELNKCKIITPENDINLFKQLDSKLKTNGGSGYHNDQRIFRLITGEITPLGIGLTTNPAADVQGILTYDTSYWGSLEEDSYTNNKKNEGNEENFSQSSKKSVLNKNNCINTMNEEKILELLEKLVGEAATKDKLSKEAVATVTDTIKDAILTKNEEFVKEKEALVKEKDILATQEKEAQDKLAQATQDIEGLKQQLSDAQDQLKKLEDERSVDQANAAFSARLEILDNIYELDDQDRKLLADELRALDITDEAFASYQEKLAVALRHKNKEFIKKQEEELQAKIDERVEEELAKRSNKEQNSSASDNNDDGQGDDIAGAMDNADSNGEEISNANSENNDGSETLVQRFKKLKREDLVETKV